MASNPDEVRRSTAERPATPSQDDLRTAYVAEMRAALATRQATAAQLEQIAAKYGQTISTDPEVLQRTIDWAKNPNANVNQIDINTSGAFRFDMGGTGALLPEYGLPSEMARANPLIPEGLRSEFAYGITPTTRISAVEPGLAQRGFMLTYDLLTSLGADKYDAQRYANRLFGLGDEMGLIDVTPGAAPIDIQEGTQAFQTGLRFGEPLTAGLGAAQALLGAAEAIPLVGVAARPVKGAILGAREARAAARAADLARPELSALRLTPEQEAIFRMTPSAEVPAIPTPRPAARPAAAQPVEVPAAPARAAGTPETSEFQIQTTLNAAPSPSPGMDLPVIGATPARRAAAETALGQQATLPGRYDFGLVDRAGNIDLTRLPVDAPVRENLRQLSLSNKAYIEARRGTMSVDETADLADKVALERVLGRRVGQAFNAEEVTAARRMLRQAATEATAAARAYRANPRDANLREQAIAAMVRTSAIQEQLAGSAAEAGRALRALREADDPARIPEINAIVRTMRGPNGKALDPEDLDTVLENLADLADNPDAASKFVASMREPDFADKIIEFRQSSLLAGPQTQSKNILSNAMFTIYRPFEFAASAGIGKLTRSADAPTFREVGRRFVGLGQGAVDGWDAVKRVWRGEDLSDTGSKIELRQQRAIGSSPDSSRAAQALGSAVQVPFKLLELGDEFFKAVNRRSNLAAAAYRQARMEAGGNAARREQLYQRYLANPTDQMRKDADAFAREMTFQKPLTNRGERTRLLANIGSRVQSATLADDPLVRFSAKIIAPFVRTPVNLAQEALDRLGLSRTIWDDVVNNATPGAREAALGKLSMGWGTVAGTFMLAENGYVTGGGPSDYRQRQALEATGWQPYSFKIGDTYYSYEGIEPFATVIGLAADINELRREQRADEEKGLGDAVIGLIGAIGSNLTDKTFSRGLAEFAELARDPERYGQTFVENFFGSFVPNILGQTTRALDPTMRQADTVGAAVQARIPGLAGELPARLDTWGEPIVRTGYSVPTEQETGLGQGLAVTYNLIMPIRKSQVDASDPVRSEVARLNLALPQMDTAIPRTVPVLDPVSGQMVNQQVTLELGPNGYNRVAQISGRAAHQVLSALIGSPQWNELDDDAKRDTISRVLSNTRQRTRDMAFATWYANQNQPTAPSEMSVEPR